MSVDRLTAALADRYRIERAATVVTPEPVLSAAKGQTIAPRLVGEGGLGTRTAPRINSLLGRAWLRHAEIPATRLSHRDILPSRGVQPREGRGA